MRPTLLALLCALAFAACAEEPTGEPIPETTGSTSTVPLVAASPTSTTSAPATTPAPTAAPTTTTVEGAAPTTTSSTTTTTLAPITTFVATPVAEVHRPLFVTGAPGDDALYIAQRDGVIRAVDPKAGLLEAPFLDISSVVLDGGIEQGLLGLAFHPEYDGNGRLFTYFTNAGDDVEIVEYTRNANGVVDVASARSVMTIPQPAVRHQAGMLEFGPEGLLYIAVGDGGSGGANGQDTTNRLGAILRIDVDAASPYAIPADNPLVGTDSAAEIWAFGLRNPWRFSIDPETNLMYIADVGQDSWEEINIVPLDVGGHNLGWSALEGPDCFAVRDCNPTGFVAPVLAYGHDDGCSVTGGYVYRGQAIPELHGHYFYGDWCGQWIRSFRYAPSEAGEPGVAEEREWTPELGRVGQITSFGTDNQGELYVTTWEGGVFRIDAVRAGG